jgi:signal transduction histidine kinase
MALLNRMVAERTEKLQKANARLEEANHRVTRASAAQLEHFACMSHEIRTPLNCVLGRSSFLLDSELTPAQEESMRMVVSSGDMLLTVVNDVLDSATPNSSRGM